jgi:hypothetical protein
MTRAKVHASDPRLAAVLELLAGPHGAAEVAAAHGVDEQELLAAKALFLAGASGRRAVGTRRSRSLLVAAAALVGASLGGVALSQSSAFPIAITQFQANTPAVASQVNGNFAALKSAIEALKTWSESKLGTSTDRNVTIAGKVSSAAITVSDTAQATSVTGPAYTSDTAYAFGVVSSESGSTETLRMDGNEISSSGTLYVQHGTATTLPTTKPTSFGGPVTVEGSLTVNGEVTVKGDVLGSRYVLTAAYNGANAARDTASNSIRVDQARLEGLCGDGDGCSIRLLMANFAYAAASPINLRDASVGPFHFEYAVPPGATASTQRAFRAAEASNNGNSELSFGGAGVDGDSTVNHVLRAWNCFFTDSLYSLGTAQGFDTAPSMFLLNYNTNTAYQPTCTLIIDD